MVCCGLSMQQNIRNAQCNNSEDNLFWSRCIFVLVDVANTGNLVMFNLYMYVMYKSSNDISNFDKLNLFVL